MTQHTYTNGNNAMHQPDDVMAMLTANRCQVRARFQQYEDTPDPYLKQIIAEHGFTKRILHMLLEEMVSYLAFTKQADEEGMRLVSNALQDQQLKELIETLHEIDYDTAVEAGFHPVMTADTPCERTQSLPRTRE